MIADRSDKIAHDLPDFDAVMRRLVRVPKSAVKVPTKATKGKRRKLG